MKNQNLSSKWYLIIVLFIFIIFSACTNGSSNQETKLEEKPKSDILTIENNQFKHLLLFRFNESATPENIAKAENELISLQNKIPQIKDIEWGLNNSPSSKAKGFTHCFILTFDSEEDLAIYLAHQDHKAYGKILHPHLEDFLVFDYWTRN